MRRVEIDCGADPEAVRRARGFVATTLESWARADMVDLAGLLVSEVVTNAIIHARTAFRLVMTSGPPAVRVEVHDGSPVPPRLIPADDEATYGRGLVLLESLSAGWGWERTGDGGKLVWFDLPPDPA